VSPSITQGLFGPSSQVRPQTGGREPAA